MKTSRMIFNTFLLLLTIVVVAECSKLPENHDAVEVLTDIIHRLGAKVAETEAKIDEEMQKMKQDNIVLSQTIQRMEAKLAETEVRKDEEMEKMKKENSRSMAELNDTFQRQVADINMLNAEFIELNRKEGRHYYSSVICFGDLWIILIQKQ